MVTGVDQRGLLATTSDLQLTGGFWEDTTIRTGGTPQFGTLVNPPLCQGFTSPFAPSGSREAWTVKLSGLTVSAEEPAVEPSLSPLIIRLRLPLEH